MYRIISVLLAVFILAGCSSKILVNRKVETKVTERAVIDSVAVTDSIDLMAIDTTEVTVLDSTPVVITMPQKIEYPDQTRVIKTTDNRDIKITIKTIVDSGRVKTTVIIPKITSKDTTVRITEIEDHTRTYVKWLIVIVVMFLGVIIFVLIRR